MKHDQSNRCILSGVAFGRPDILFTPAYWADQVAHWGESIQPRGHRLGRTLKEEAAACILGGHGIPAEIALAAFNRLRDRCLLDCDDAALLERALKDPLDLLNGRKVRYRFAATKSDYLAHMHREWSLPPSQLRGPTLRDWFLRFRGVGLKTASWIVRNWFDCDEVAILDIHIIRAGIIAGFYSHDQRVERCYRQMERQFIDFSGAIGARPSILDAIIWAQMKHAGELAHHACSRYNAVTGQKRRAA